jgi:quercetin dioxygenase-like cupin family protein
MKDLVHDDFDTGTLEWAGVTFRTVVSTAETGGTMAVVDSTAPAGFGPGRHVHAAEDETFLVLTGEMEFWVAGRRFCKGPGEAAFIPRGVEHTFKALSESRHILILTPGGFEGFFTDMARGGFRIPEDMPAILESGARHNLTFTGPPL